MAHQLPSQVSCFCHSDQLLVLFKHFSLLTIKMSAYRLMKNLSFTLWGWRKTFRGNIKAIRHPFKKKADYFLSVVLYHFTFSICLFHIIYYLTLFIFNHFWLLINKHALMSSELAFQYKLYIGWKTGFSEVVSLFGTCMHIWWCLEN